MRPHPWNSILWTLLPLVLPLVFSLVFSLGFPLAQGAELTPQASLSWWNAGSYRHSDLLHSTDYAATSELRPDVKIDIKNLNASSSPESASFPTLTLRGRPRFIGTLTHTTSDLASSLVPSSTKSKGTTQWSEATLSISPNDTLALHYGLQNFQWGPAEAVSPSNRIVRESIQSKDILYDTRGKHLIRVNATPLQNWSEVLLHEITDNGDTAFTAHSAMSKKLALKSEWSWGGGANYLGQVTGWRARGEGFWIGEYFQQEIADGWSLYCDFAHEKGSRAWYPSLGPTLGGFTFVNYTQSKRDLDRVQTEGVTGLRYVFTSGEDIRVEWIYEEAGYSRDQSRLLTSAGALTSSNSGITERPGLSFTPMHSLLASVRLPDAFKKKDWNLYLRTLLSPRDGSTLNYLSSENALGTSGTFFGTVTITTGDDHSDYHGLLHSALTLGYRYNL